MDSQMNAPFVTGTVFHHTLSFGWLHEPGKSIDFPCDETGGVDSASLSESMQLVYQGALAMVGQYYSRPTIQLPS